ncbi:MAG TPA: hypothetical protein VMZ53_03840 [Kofleriaceae bacterium]|nr:hypothetical protein [Kofleriaceae bacterium]
MGDVYFTTNPAEFSRLPGLYVSERLPAGFIRGVDLGTVGMATKCVRGPLTPVLITSSGRFTEVFGGRDYGSGGAAIGQGWLALVNKPFGTLVIRRVAAADAVKASFTDETAAGGAGTAVLRVDASSVGAWGSNVKYKIGAATDGDANKFNLTVSYLGEQVLYENLDIHAANYDNLAAAVGSDDARFVDLVKVASGRPKNTIAGADGADADGWIALGTVAAGFTSVAGSEGTLAVGDYNSGMDDLAVYPGVGICLVPEAVTGSAVTFHSNLVTLASEVSDRIFLTWAQAHGQSVSAEAAQVAAQITTRSDRIVWCYNSAYTLDPETDSEVQTAPHVWLASILSQIDVDVHAGSFETVAYLAGITRVTNTSLSRPDLITLQDAGICQLERTTDGFQFRSVVTTDLTEGKTELARRRACDYLQLSAADRLRYYVKRKNTATNRAGAAAELVAFSEDLRARERVVEDYEIDQESVNNATQRARGEERILWRVRLIGHILSLVLETDIGTGTVIER